MKRRGRDSLPATQGRTNRNRPTVRQHGSFFLCRRPRTSWASRSGTDEKSTEGEGAVYWNRRHGGRQSVGVSALPSHDDAWLRALYAAADVSSSHRHLKYLRCLCLFQTHRDESAASRLRRTASNCRDAGRLHLCLQSPPRSTYVHLRSSKMVLPKLVAIFVHQGCRGTDN